MTGQESTEIAIFPIPDCVTFPGTEIPLHVFEPRYRQMMKDCLGRRLPLGVTHTRKVISRGRDCETVSEALQTNRDTYAPQAIFSAGTCELLEELEDGRMLVNVRLEQRYRLLRETQTLPYRIAECEPVPDEPLDPAGEDRLHQLRLDVSRRLVTLTADLPEVRNMLESPVWQARDDASFSMAIFAIVRFPTDFQQELLEETSPVRRLESALAALDAGVPA